MANTTEQRVLLSETLSGLEILLRNTLGKMSCPWWQCHEAAVNSFHAEFKFFKPSFIIFFRKTLYVL
jgi:hypothetical protein